MRLTATLAAATAVVALAAPATAGAEQQNPYTATRVCGPGYAPIDRHQLVDPNHGKLLSEVVLTYNAAQGKNCVVNLKRYRVGLGRRYQDNLMAELYTRPFDIPANVQSNQGAFQWFAGPVYVSAPSKCVQWGGQADLIFEPNHEVRGTYHSAFRSGWTHCR